MFAILSLLSAVYTAEMPVEVPEVMSQSDVVTVVAKDAHYVVLYNEKGNFIRSVYVTSGEIIGQPVISGNRCTVVAEENGCRIIIVYELPQFRQINRHSI